MTTETTASDTAAPPVSLWREALLGIPQMTRQQWRDAPLLLRWLVATRASVLPLTIFAVLFAVILAPPANAAQWMITLAVLVALTLAHATNNLLNDYIDHRSGLDRDNYFRTRYGVHVLESGLLEGRTFLYYLWLTGLSALIVGAAVCLYRGGWVYLFAALGAFFVLFYTWPLKRWALGELAVFLTWGPLMVAGTCLSVSGELSLAVLAAAAVYGLGPTVVIFAKHTDKAEQDQERGVLTLPVLMRRIWGESGPRRAISVLAVTQWVAAIVVGLAFGWYGMLGVVLSLPALLSLLRVSAAAMPEAPPEGYPEQAWPLWYTTYGFLFARNAGAGLILGMLVQGFALGTG